MDQDLADNLLDREFSTLEIALSGTAARTAVTLDQYIQTRLSQGSAIDVIRADLLKDLREGGRIFGEFKRSIKAKTFGSINRIRDVGITSEFGTEIKYRWAAVLVNTCPDCMDRHGVSKSWEEWETEGMPRSGSTVCQHYCRCMLIPEEYSVMEPVKRDRRA